jgi:hypothetical protein
MQLNHQEYDKGGALLENFMFFSDEEQTQLMFQKTQRMINSVQHVSNRAYNVALARRAAAKLDTASDQSFDDDYYSNHPIKILAARKTTLTGEIERCFASH